MLDFNVIFYITAFAAALSILGVFSLKPKKNGEPEPKKSPDRDSTVQTDESDQQHPENDESGDDVSQEESLSFKQPVDSVEKISKESSDLCDPAFIGIPEESAIPTTPLEFHFEDSDPSSIQHTLSFGSHEEQGRRKTMEDAVTTIVRCSLSFAFAFLVLIPVNLFFFAG